MLENTNHYRKIIVLLVAAIFAFVGSAQSTQGQVKSPAKTDEYVYPNPQNTDNLFLYGMMANNCEATRANMEMVIEEANKKKDSSLIVIFRLENGERTSLYDFRQRDLINFLQRYYTGKYVIALGDKVKEIGRADIYVGGKLAFGLGFDRNSKRLCTQ